MNTTTIPAQLLNDHCYVCGRAVHNLTTHVFWSNQDARQEFAGMDRIIADDPAASYVATYRPY